MKQKKFYLVLFSILAFVLYVNDSMGQVVVVDSVISSGFFNPGGLTKITKDTKSKEITILIKDKTPELKLQIGAKITSGTISFTIYDPTGKKRDDLSLTWTEEGKCHTILEDLPSQKTGFTGGQPQSDDLTGTFIASYKNPLSGKWVIKVSPNQSNGSYKIYHISSK